MIYTGSGSGCGVKKEQQTWIPYFGIEKKIFSAYIFIISFHVEKVLLFSFDVRRKKFLF